MAIKTQTTLKCSQITFDEKWPFENIEWVAFKGWFLPVTERNRKQSRSSAYAM